MNCPSCGAAVALENVFPGGSMECGCGASVAVPVQSESVEVATSPSLPPPSRAEDLDVLCPRCHGALVLREEDGLVVTACPAHHGLFVRRAALEALTAGDPHATEMVAALDEGRIEHAPAPDESPSLPCPRCREPMRRATFSRGSTVSVDICAAHGTWFDAGELRAAAAGVVAAAVTTGDVLRRSATTLEAAIELEAARDLAPAGAGNDDAADVLEAFDEVVLGRRGPDGRRTRRG